MDFKEHEKKYWDEFYDQNNSSYHESNDLIYHHDFKKYIKKLDKGSKVLQLACGVRYDGVEFAKDGLIMYETDISETAVLKTEEVYQKLGIEKNGEFFACDAEHLPFDDNFFDASFIIASFHHLPDPQKALIEMKRVTKKDGFIILGLEPNSWPYFTIFWLLKPLKIIVRKINKKFFHSIADDTTHGFSRRELLSFVKEADLELVDIKRAKYLSELYDSSIRLLSKIIKKPIKLNNNMQNILAKLDDFISGISFINFFNWHWSVIAKKK